MLQDANWVLFICLKPVINAIIDKNSINYTAGRRMIYLMSAPDNELIERWAYICHLIISTASVYVLVLTSSKTDYEMKKKSEKKKNIFSANFLSHFPSHFCSRKLSDLFCFVADLAERVSRCFDFIESPLAK